MSTINFSASFQVMGKVPSLFPYILFTFSFLASGVVHFQSLDESVSVTKLYFIQQYILILLYKYSSLPKQLVYLQNTCLCVLEFLNSVKM